MAGDADTSRPRGPRWTLGVAGSHNGAAALYRDDELVCAIQEERLTRNKREVLRLDRPSQAVAAVLADQGITAGDLDLVVKAPLTLDEASASAVLAPCPHLTLSHHRAHALSAYACSGFEDTLALVVDGLGSSGRDLPPDELAVARGEADAAIPGELREAVSVYRIARGELTPLDKVLARTGYAAGQSPTPLGPFSTLGLMYQQVARLSFGSWDAAGKVMGLAPHGRPIFSTDEFLELRDDGRIEFKDDLFGIGGLIAAEHPQIRPYPADRATHEGLAASVQSALEQGLMHLVRHARGLSGAPRLVCAGGVFLNSVANELILRSGLFSEVFVVPFAEDSGCAVGAAFAGVRRLLGPRVGRRLEADSLGPLPRDLDAALRLATSHCARISTGPIAALVPLLASGGVIGFVSGRSELGPRALGHRSILCDPRTDVRDSLNRRKGREAFRPFAPAVLAEDAANWFEVGQAPASPFMLRVVPVRAERRELVPAIAHVDGTARLQTVTERSPLHPLLLAWRAATSCPMLLNTSFNRAGEPIVETFTDAVRSALAMGLDALWLDDGNGETRLVELVGAGT